MIDLKINLTPLNLTTPQVFNSAQCPLSQEVLLSLIQQLSVDLGDKTEVTNSFPVQLSQLPLLQPSG